MHCLEYMATLMPYPNQDQHSNRTQIIADHWKHICDPFERQSRLQTYVIQVIFKPFFGGFLASPVSMLLVSAQKYPAVQKFYAERVKPDVPILSAAEQFGADPEVEAALDGLSEALSDGNFDSAKALSPLISAGLEADPMVAVSLLSAVGMDAAAPDDLHAYALIVSKVIHDLTTPSSVDIGQASSNLYRLSCLQGSTTNDVLQIFQLFVPSLMCILL